MNNLKYKEFYKRNLPHFQPDEGTFAITFRLAFSLPMSIIVKLKTAKIDFKKKSKILKGIELKLYKEEFEKKYYEDFDSFIGLFNKSENWLEKEFIARIVSESIDFWNEKRYELFCFCIMPNHVHLIIKPFRKDKEQFYSISEILYSIKRFTAGECNKVLNRKGQFWQHEHYDHLIRNYDDFMYQLNYILENPVKADLVENWENWEYTFLKKELK